MKDRITVEISARTIVFTVFFILFVYFIGLIRDILFSIFIAFIFRSALLPIVLRLKRWHFPQTFAAVVVFFSFVTVFAGFLVFVFPPLIIETSNFLRTIPDYLEFILPAGYEFNLDSSLNLLPNVTSSVFSLVGSLFSNTFFIIMTLFLSLYFLIQENFVRDLLINFVSDDQVVWIVEITKKVERRLAAWLWGELFLMLVIGVFTYVGLKLLGVRYALSLAVLAGLLEVVPNVGPVLSLIPAFLISLSTSYLQAVSVAALYFVIQQLENTLIVPLVMKKAVGINPIVTLIGLVIGGRLGGILGIVLSIPAILFIETIIVEVLKRKTESISYKEV